MNGPNFTVITTCRGLERDPGLAVFLGSLSLVKYAYGVDRIKLIVLGANKELFPRVVDAKGDSAFDVIHLPLPGRTQQINADRFHVDWTSVLMDPDTRVVWCDCRDVYFQRYPIPFEMWDDPHRVHVFAEDTRYTCLGEHANGSWLKAVHGPNFTPAYLTDQPILCAGVIIGRWGELRMHLGVVSRRLRDAPDIYGMDQALHEDSVHACRGEDSPYRVWTNESGPVVHLVLAKLNILPIQGVVLNEAGTVPCIVHQYDRHPVLKSFLYQKFTFGSVKKETP